MVDSNAFQNTLLQIFNIALMLVSYLEVNVARFHECDEYILFHAGVSIFISVVSVIGSLGDIYDMWIRDSTEQIWPYFVLIQQYQYIELLIHGLVLKQAQLIYIDIYSNSYNAESYCYDKQLKLLIKQPLGATHDFEIDSPAYFLKLLYEYYSQTGDVRIFVSMDNIVKKTIYHIIETWELEQYHDTKSEYKVHNNKGEDIVPVEYTGMIWTSHRPSDDIVRFPYHIPDNFFVHESLDIVKYFARTIFKDDELYQRCEKLQEDIYGAIQKYGVTKHEKYGDIYCYETDGKDCNLMDDANIPSLLSIPLITKKYDKKIYGNTRKWILSDNNPTYIHSNKTGIKGVGSTHTMKNNIWPLSLITQGLTQTEDNMVDNEYDKYELLVLLMNTTGSTGQMHESFNADNPKKYTRKFFSWANSYFSMYANCGMQFLNFDQATDLIEDKEVYEPYLGSMDAIQSILSKDIYDENPTFIQWIKECEPTVDGIKRHVDDNRKLYQDHILTKMHEYKYG